MVVMKNAEALRRKEDKGKHFPYVIFHFSFSIGLNNRTETHQDAEHAKKFTRFVLIGVI